MNDKEMMLDDRAQKLVNSVWARTRLRTPQEDVLVSVIAKALTEAEQRGYRLGQEDMRERAATDTRKAFYKSPLATAPGLQLLGEGIAERIGALPISPQQDPSGSSSPALDDAVNFVAGLVEEPEQEGEPDDR